MVALQPQIAGLLEQTNPGHETQIDQLLQTELYAAMTAMMPRLLDAMAEVYVQELTEEELQAPLAFYHSIPGRLLLAKQPRLVAAGMAIGQRIGAEAGAQAGRRVLERARAAGFKVQI